MIDNSQNTALVEVFKSTDGTKFFGYINPLEISALRGLAAEKAKRFLDMNITNRSLQEIVDEGIRAFNTGDYVVSASILHEINFRLRFLCEENSILDLVCIYFFLQDENPELPSAFHNKKKHEIFENDLVARGFFLQIGLSLCKKFSQKQEKDMLSYLEENKTLSERIRRFIASESQINLTNTSTN